MRSVWERWPDMHYYVVDNSDFTATAETRGKCLFNNRLSTFYVQLCGNGPLIVREKPLPPLH